MKFPKSEWAYIFREFRDGKRRRDILALLLYTAFLAVVIFLYAALFQVIMVAEGQSHSWITAIYWTLVTMSTVGFGDVTFTSDVGRLFSLAVLVSGIVLLVVVLPFTFIRLFYAPWLEAQVRVRTPRRVPSSVRGHVIISRYDEIAARLIERLWSSGIPYYVVEPDPTAAAHLLSEGISVRWGGPDLCRGRIRRQRAVHEFEHRLTVTIDQGPFERHRFVVASTDLVAGPVLALGHQR